MHSRSSSTEVQKFMKECTRVMYSSTVLTFHLALLVYVYPRCVISTAYTSVYINDLCMYIWMINRVLRYILVAMSHLPCLLTPSSFGIWNTIRESIKLYSCCADDSSVKSHVDVGSGKIYIKTLKRQIQLFN